MHRMADNHVDTRFNGGPKIQESRGYQLEMLQESLRRNIIIAMDTGSGKTHVAILRIEAELERCASEKLVWFLCPTVALAQQQHHVVTDHLRSVQTRLLSGNDGIDRWGEQEIWDNVLRDIRVVVSTHQVLLDALIHGFVRMASLALLIFDEAHHCISSHPANRIMRDFYHSSLNAEKPVPHILGLTASPIMNNKGGGLQTIEQNINAISRTPKVRRSELLQHVHQPQIVTLTFPPCLGAHSSLLIRLGDLYKNLNIQSDPYVLKLRAEGHGSDSKQLQKVLLSNKTYCQDQMKSLLTMAMNVNQELGKFASEWYITTCIDRFRKKRFDNSMLNLDHSERAYLIELFLPFPDPIPGANIIPEPCDLSPKVQQLLDCLAAEMIDGFAGLLFVQTRASVGLLARLIAIHPQTKHKAKVGTFVGTSNSDKRKLNIGELHELGEQNETLEDLRSGKKNLVVTTSVLEEGIDVSKCNCIICFERPPNLKSFIQRRGRARSSKSKYIIMFPELSPDAVGSWKELEEEMRKVYMDDMRHLATIRNLEERDQGERAFTVQKTSAKITLQDAVGHLYHFCSKLPRIEYGDQRPVFVFEEDAFNCLRGNVILPKSVDKSVRETKGIAWWQSEEIAKQDAAFEAYVALYKAGLVNDHLLPLMTYDEAAVMAYSEVEKRPSLVSVRQQFSPWPAVAAAWRSGCPLQQNIISFSSPGTIIPPLMMISPFSVTTTIQLTLYLNKAETVQVSIDRHSAPYTEDIAIAGSMMTLILRSVFRGRMEHDRSGFTLLFEPVLGAEERKCWLHNANGTRPASSLYESGMAKTDVGLIRDLSQNGTPWVFQGLEHLGSELPEHFSGEEYTQDAVETKLFLKVIKLPKRTDLLHEIPSSASSSKANLYTHLPADTCSVDNLPYSYAQMAMFVPAIIHRIEQTLITDHLCIGLLAPVQFENRGLVTRATTTTSARDAENYQELEFLGDCCLKLYASNTLMSDHLNWHEGYLSHRKDHIVSNGRLATAAQDTGLDQYIRTKPFTGHKWRPLYNEDFLDVQSTETRELSTKTLADVVEALIGAAYLDGGHPKVISCLSVFLPDLSWRPLKLCNAVLLQAASTNESVLFPSHFGHLETLVGYVFTTKTLLLEALTHPSHLGPDVTPSYDRFEYLGDSVLDFIVTTRIYQHRSSLSTPRMHLLRTAMVNANFLAFACMRHCTWVSRTSLPTTDRRSISSNPDSKVALSIWHFMRHSHSHAIVSAQSRCHERFLELQPLITEALVHGDSYPWTLLSVLGADKFFSDVIESIIAAIYIDAAGSLSACEGFLTALGVLPYLDRTLSEGLHVWHPKEELGVVAGNEKVRYELINEHNGDGDGENDATRQKGYSVRVWVGDKVISAVRGVRTRIEAETRAAEKAVGELRKRQVNKQKPLDEPGEALPSRESLGDEEQEATANSGDNGEEDEEAIWHDCLSRREDTPMMD